LLLLGLLAFIARPQSNEQHLRWLYPAATAGGLVLISAAAYAALDSWVPIAMPATTLAVASALLLTRPRRRLSVPDLAVDTEGAGQRLLAEGRLEEAWTVYRAVPPTRELFEELYELGHQLDLAGFAELAADAFHRIALVDVKYKDVAARLVRATRWHAENANDEDGEEHKLPAKIGPYELLEPIGSGSTGRVLLARDSRINRIVAVKIIDLLAEFEPSELVQAKDQFRREAETAGRLSHPNIVTIYDIGEADSLAYIAMAYLKGRHLSDFTATNQLLPIDLVLQLGAQAADALDYAHDQNVVHRDIKPANIMYDSLSGSLTITDFGIARLIDVSRTRTGIVLGKPSFMAPEQLEGRNVNGHTDLFALGVTLYELLTGRLPFRGASMTELMFVIANEPHQPVTAVRPDLPADLDSVIDRALAKEPSERYARGADMADALRAAAQR
jgi:serine/threonine-protein kinase